MRGRDARMRTRKVQLVVGIFHLQAAGVVGLLGPLLLGIPRIKRQEREVLSIEARRRDLADIFDGNRELGFDQ